MTFQGILKKQNTSLDCFCKIIKLFDISLIETRCGNMQFLLFYYPSLGLLAYANLNFDVESLRALFFFQVCCLSYIGKLWERTLEQ